MGLPGGVGMATLTDLEVSVCRAILRWKTPRNANLRAQLEQAEVRRRENTGAGMWTWFHVPRGMPPAEAGPSPLGNLAVLVEGLQHPAGFLLWVEEGYVESLECFTIADDTWPDQCPADWRIRLHAFRDVPESFLTPAEVIFEWRDPVDDEAAAWIRALADSERGAVEMVVVALSPGSPGRIALCAMVPATSRSDLERVLCALAERAHQHAEHIAVEANGYPVAAITPRGEEGTEDLLRHFE